MGSAQSTPRTSSHACISRLCGHDFKDHDIEEVQIDTEKPYAVQHGRLSQQQPAPRKAMTVFGGRPDSLIIPTRKIASSHGPDLRRTSHPPRAGMPKPSKPEPSSRRQPTTPRQNSQRPYRSRKRRKVEPTGLRPGTLSPQRLDPLDPDDVLAASKSKRAVPPQANDEEFLLVRSIAENLSRAQSPAMRHSHHPAMEKAMRQHVSAPMRTGNIPPNGSHGHSRSQTTKSSDASDPPRPVVHSLPPRRRPVFTSSPQPSEGPNQVTFTGPAPAMSRPSHRRADSGGLRGSQSSGNRRKIFAASPLGRSDVEEEVRELQDIVTARREEDVVRRSTEAPRDSGTGATVSREAHRPAIAPGMSMGVRSSLLDDIGSAFVHRSFDPISPVTENPPQPPQRMSSVRRSNSKFGTRRTTKMNPTKQRNKSINSPASPNGGTFFLDQQQQPTPETTPRPDVNKPSPAPLSELPPKHQQPHHTGPHRVPAALPTPPPTTELRPESPTEPLMDLPLQSPNALALETHDPSGFPMRAYLPPAAPPPSLKTNYTPRDLHVMGQLRTPSRTPSASTSTQQTSTHRHSRRDPSPSREQQQQQQQQTSLLSPPSSYQQHSHQQKRRPNPLPLSSDRRHFHHHHHQTHPSTSTATTMNSPAHHRRKSNRTSQSTEPTQLISPLSLAATGTGTGTGTTSEDVRSSTGADMDPDGGGGGGGGELRFDEFPRPPTRVSVSRQDAAGPAPGMSSETIVPQRTASKKKKENIPARMGSVERKGDEMRRDAQAHGHVQTRPPVKRARRSAERDKTLPLLPTAEREELQRQRVARFMTLAAAATPRASRRPAAGVLGAERSVSDGLGGVPAREDGRVRRGTRGAGNAGGGGQVMEERGTEGVAVGRSASARSRRDRGSQGASGDVGIAV